MNEIAKILGSIWKVEILSNVTLFIWNCFLDKILTLNHLQNRGWNLANRCALCMEEEEYVNPILIHCSMTKVVWAFFLSHLQIPWIFSNMFHELISGWGICGLDRLSFLI